MEKWLDVTKSVYFTGKSTATINRLVSKYKTDKKIINYTNNKPFINLEFLKNKYPFIHDNRNETNDNAKHKKEALEIAYKAKDLKAQSDILQAKDKQIEQLINKKSYLAFYVTLGFVILFIVLGIISYYMFINYQSEQKENKQQEIKLLTSKYDMEVNFKDKLITDKEDSLNETKKELLETKTAYQQSLKAVDSLHIKYNDKLDTKEKHYQSDLKLKSDLLKSEQQKIKTLEEKLNELSASHSKSAADSGTGEQAN